MCPGRIKKFSLQFTDASGRNRSPPSTFLLPCPHAPKLAAIARYCSRSLKRALDESMAAGLIVPLMERLISDHDPLIYFCANFLKMGVPQGAASKMLESMCFISFLIDFNES